MNMLSPIFCSLLDRYGYSGKEQQQVKSLMHALMSRDKYLGEHSAKVGILSENIARVFGYDPTNIVVAGGLHDIGKIKALDELAAIIDGKDYDSIMGRHTEYGEEIIRRIFGPGTYAAEVALRHHMFQSKPIPEKLPQMDGKATYVKHVEEGVLYVAVADYYNALGTRMIIDPKNGKSRKRSRDEVKKSLYDHCSRFRSMISTLYSKGVFS
jgi:putative nucleotidyltransferase with HDIG domain